jgi:hypothetical protein
VTIRYGPNCRITHQSTTIGVNVWNIQLMIDVQLVTNASSGGLLRSSMETNMLCRVNIARIRYSIVKTLCTDAVQLFNIIFGHKICSAMEKLLSSEHPTFRQLQSSFKYTVNVLGIPPPFAVHLSMCEWIA